MATPGEKRAAKVKRTALPPQAAAMAAESFG